MGDNAISNHAKKKSKTNKKLKTIAAISDEVKNKVKAFPITPDEVEKLDVKDAETEDLAESVDSGCIPDSSSDIMADAIDTAQVKDNILQHMYIMLMFSLLYQTNLTLFFTFHNKLCCKISYRWKLP